MQRRIDASFDKPRHGDAGEIGSDEGENAEDEKASITVNEKFDALIIAKNRSVLLPALVCSPSAIAILSKSRGPGKPRPTARP